MQTTIMVSPGTSGGTEVETTLDATEDRLIHEVELLPRSANWTATDMHIELFTGNDPTSNTAEPTADDVDDNEELYVRQSSLIEADTTNGQGGSYLVPAGRFNFSTPYEWDEHVTLTLQAVNQAGSQTPAMAIVRYTEV